MEEFEKDEASGVLDAATGPCLSLYQPTHRRHPENQQDVIRYRNLVKTLQASLQQHHAAADVDELLAPFRALADDTEFWNGMRDGLAVLGSRDLFRTYRLQRPVDELAIVAETFHLKPLTRLFQSTERYQVLGLTRKAIRLFEGDRDAIDEIALAPGVARTIEDALGAELTEARSNIRSTGGTSAAQGGTHHGQGGKSDEVDKDDERFFRIVDRDILAHHSKSSGLPLILATNPEHRDLFHRVSHNPHLLERGIDISADAVSLDDLRQRAWQVVEPFYSARLQSQLEQFGTARAKGLGGESLQTVAEAVVTGRVATLLIDGDRLVPGHVDPETGRVILADRSRPDVDDVLDDLASLARRRGGKVFIVPGDQLPAESGVAAIYRY
ncbi:MAG TPA: hypothetical protein VE861_07520 [Gemmatimonadaceae bacterium]|nr:hypothetical protein [Gemmatimonadaceae bacterium]